MKCYAWDLEADTDNNLESETQRLTEKNPNVLVAFQKAEVESRQAGET